VLDNDPCAHRHVINRAGVVTVFDLSEVLTGCGTNNANADLNCDGTIQRVDLSSLLI